jgi:ABC-type Na+ transport system ATPase subunit NatA
MPELRGIQAPPEIKAEWVRAYGFYRQATGVPHDPKLDRTERINYVARMMNITRKQAKRRVKNFEAWQRNIKKGLVQP